MMTLSAGHMVAASILLDRGSALRALLGVCVDPIGSLRVIFTFFDPHLDQLTESRLVITEGAPEAESVLA